MRLTTNTRQSGGTKKLTIYAAGLCAVLLLQGCNRLMKHETRFGSHKVTISRHGSSHEFYTTSEFYANEQAGVPVFHYNGYGSASGTLQVVIKNEEVIVGGQVYAQLDEGDAVEISDDGVTVSSTNKVETARDFQTSSEHARP